MGGSKCSKRLFLLKNIKSIFAARAKFLYIAGMKATTSQKNTQINSPARICPLKNLSPESLSRALEAFECGRLGQAARIFEAVLKRDDIISGLYQKRCKCIARLEPEIVETENSPKAKRHAEILRAFYSSIEARDAFDKNRIGGARLLISQMMDAVAMKYSCHKIEFVRRGENISANFTRYPLWMFENTGGELRLLEREGQLSRGTELNPAEWLIFTADALMAASSIAYLYKTMALRDWAIYCRRNGMPGITAKTDAFPGSEQWIAACKAASDFGAEFHAVFSQGTDMEAIDMSSKGELPYPKLVERMDRALCALWRGGDLATLSGSERMGSASQWYESTIIEEDDAENISSAFNRQIDPAVIKLSCGDETPLARFALRLPDYETHIAELEVFERLAKMGLKGDPYKIAKRFGFPLAEDSRANGGENNG